MILKNAVQFPSSEAIKCIYYSIQYSKTWNDCALQQLSLYKCSEDNFLFPGDHKGGRKGIWLWRCLARCRPCGGDHMMAELHYRPYSCTYDHLVTPVWLARGNLVALAWLSKAKHVGSLALVLFSSVNTRSIVPWPVSLGGLCGSEAWLELWLLSALEELLVHDLVLNGVCVPCW